VQPPSDPYFRCSLFPLFVETDGGRVGRFLLPTFWQVRSLLRAGVEGVPQRHDALVVLDDLFHSVLPYSFRQHQRLHTRPLSTSVPPWRGIPCTAAQTDVWLLAVDGRTTLRLVLTVRLPDRPADPDPQYPLIGFEFFRHYQPRVILDYVAFPPPPLPDIPDPVGSFELV
jgi:hypothetical protein